jgi:hypothetical protein
MPQPEMFRVSISKVTSSYQRSLSGREVVGAVLGEKSSQKSVQSWMWAPNKRSRTSYRDVWFCANCHSSSPPTTQEKSGSSQSIVGAAVTLLVIGVIYVAIVAKTDVSSSSSNGNETSQGKPLEVGVQVASDKSVKSNKGAISDANEIMSNFVIQVGSFSVQENLEVAEQILRRLGLTHKREAALVNGGEFWRLLVSVSQNDDVASILEILRENGFVDAFVQ